MIFLVKSSSKVDYFHPDSADLIPTMYDGNGKKVTVNLLLPPPKKSKLSDQEDSSDSSEDKESKSPSPSPKPKVKSRGRVKGKTKQVKKPKPIPISPLISSQKPEDQSKKIAPANIATELNKQILGYVKAAGKIPGSKLLTKTSPIQSKAKPRPLPLYKNLPKTLNHEKYTFNTPESIEKLKSRLAMTGTSVVSGRGRRKNENKNDPQPRKTSKGGMKNKPADHSSLPASSIMVEYKGQVSNFDRSSIFNDLPAFKNNKDKRNERLGTVKVQTPAIRNFNDQSSYGMNQNGEYNIQNYSGKGNTPNLINNTSNNHGIHNGDNSSNLESPMESNGWTVVNSQQGHVLYQNLKSVNPREQSNQGNMFPNTTFSFVPEMPYSANRQTTYTQCEPGKSPMGAGFPISNNPVSSPTSIQSSHSYSHSNEVSTPCSSPYKNDSHSQYTGAPLMVPNSSCQSTSSYQQLNTRSDIDSYNPNGMVHSLPPSTSNNIYQQHGPFSNGNSNFNSSQHSYNEMYARSPPDNTSGASTSHYAPYRNEFSKFNRTDHHQLTPMNPCSASIMNSTNVPVQTVDNSSIYNHNNYAKNNQDSTRVIQHAQNMYSSENTDIAASGNSLKDPRVTLMDTFSTINESVQHIASR